MAEVANRVVSNYERAGKILRTDSKPRTDKAEAEHLLVAILINPQFLEAAFAHAPARRRGAGGRLLKRVPGAKAGNEMSAWHEERPVHRRHADGVDGLPPLARIKTLR